MPMQATLILGFLGTIAAMICIYIFVIPEKKYNTLTPFLKWLADLFNFKKLWLESILKFFYILLTTICIIYGALMLVSVQETYWGDQSMAGMGIVLLLVGPIVVRLTYESLMMFIILVKNVIEINNRFKNNVCGQAAPVAEPEPITTDRTCSGCGNVITETDMAFCPNCGNKL